jgi:hypothetical protein
MKKFKIISVIIILISISFLYCKKKVDKDRHEFIGYWYARTGEYNRIILDISEDSKSVCTIRYEGYEHRHTGTARANSKCLEINDILYFDIVEYPHNIDTSVEKVYVWYVDNSSKLANWKMVLYGPKPNSLHESGTVTYYKADY